MKRESYSVLRVPSTSDGEFRVVKDTLHIYLLRRAETLQGVAGYALYQPTITYWNGRKHKESSFPMSVRFDDGQLELWATTWNQSPDSESLLERARHAHAEHMGATYRLFTSADFYRNPIATQNRDSIHAYLACWYKTDTAALERQLLAALSTAVDASIRELAAAVAHRDNDVQVAVYRLLVKGQLTGDLETSRVSPDWRVRRTNHA